ncbi:MAG: hypothetical protein QN169_09830, partial [Armatimonadota bacterium]|nr:hypothetical protein [Armatimonadota bacterium]
MSPLVGALTVGVGIHLVVALFLLLRYLDGRERLFGWWSLAYAFFALHVFVEAVLAMGASEGWFLPRHLLFLAAAWAMLCSFRPVWWAAALAAAVGATVVVFRESWFAAAVAASLGGAAGFTASAVLLYRQEGGLAGQSTRLLFWGLLLTGV